MKYYKITNREELHHGMQYRTGSNVDIRPFYPYGSCKPGGIYFTNIENILAFLKFGIWIREVTIPDDEEIYEDPTQVPKKWKAHKIILGERRLITLDVIKELIAEGADIHADGDAALYWATKSGLLEIVKYLVEMGADIYAGENQVLYTAVKCGHLEMVKYLVEKGANIHANGDEAFFWAVRDGRLDIVKYLKSL